jgi:glycosyltransferase involved in cell wall biosynthesis
MPRVSVVMSVYNHEQYVGHAIDSILQQTFRDFEFVIVDDGSEDNTPQLLKGYHDPRLKIYRQDNQGQSIALNQGIRLTAGTYIARMDADDVALPERLEREVRFLDAHPDIALVGTWCMKVNTATGEERLQRLPEDNATIRRFLVVDNPFIHSSVMIRRSIIEAIGLYDEGLIWQDYDLWVRVARNHGMANIPEPLMVRRKHPASISGTARESRKSWERFQIQIKASRQVGWTYSGLCAMVRSLAEAGWWKTRGR